MRYRLAVSLVLLVAALCIPPTGRAEDFFLTIGGGHSPTGNQLSLERNVIFQQSVLAEQRPDKPRYDVYFADGNDNMRDLQCRDPDFEANCPPARRMMAELFGDADSMDLFYRTNQVQGLSGPAEKSLIRRRMRDLARELRPGDRLLVYVTGHGGPADDSDDDDDDYEYEYDDESQTWRARERRREGEDERNRYDTSFYMWESDSVSASEFAGWLDRLPHEVEVVLVMVQCFAGGFAHTIFQQADADLGLAPHARCGFFAQVHNRGAAGCTADANEADYEEYSSYFWSALGGRTRTGEEIGSADYNRDGQVSFAEAHAFAIIESDTIDVPVRTTGALLQRYSRQARPRRRRSNDEDDNSFGRILGSLGSQGASPNPQGLIQASGPLARLIESARADQRAILERLPAKLGLGPNATVEDARRKLREVRGDSNSAGSRLRRATETEERSLERVQEELREIWPELHADLPPLAIELASNRADEFEETVAALPSYKALQRSKERVEQLSEERMKFEREEARLQRLLQTCESVALAANLPRLAPREIVERYQRLLAMEEGTLVQSREQGARSRE
ncbi:MAG TPA: hypothetical protein VGK58_10920 [Lacipirellulaceae bacterium]